MRKIFFYLLVLICCMASLGACSEKSTEYAISEFDSESKIVIGDGSGETEGGRENAATGEFTVKEKKYTFEGTDLMLLEVTNGTNKNYIVTVNASYLDRDGNVLKTEVQTFDQFGTGYMKYFLFRPGIVFDEFIYTLETEETHEVLYAPRLKARLAELFERGASIDSLVAQGDYRLYPSIIAHFEYEEDVDEVLDVRSEWLLFSEKDELIAIVPLGTYLRDDIEGQQWIMYQTTDEELVWPEKFKGNVRAVHVLKSLVLGEYQ